jgi:dienelactone hydrolase
LNKQLQASSRLFLVIISLFSINGCVTSSLIETKTEAVKAGFQQQQIQTELFSLTAFIKIKDVAANKIVIYIEGDGQAWKRKNKLSDDPTPGNPIGLKLAVNDVAPNVVYLARPCQYLKKERLKECSTKYWSSHRYAEEVIDAMSETITKIKSRIEATSIEIIGFSGGGVIAMLIASFRHDVSKIVTIAANIDHESWSEWHGVSKLNGSLTPLNYLAGLEGVNQLHFWGGKDKIVPYKTQLSFIASFEKNALFKYKIIPDFNHDCCWVEHWQDIYP